VTLALACSLAWLFVASVRDIPAQTVSFSFIGYSNGMATACFDVINSSRDDVFIHPFAVIQTNTPLGWTNAAIEWWRGDQESMRLDAVERSRAKVISFKTPDGSCRWRAVVCIDRVRRSLLGDLRGDVPTMKRTNLYSAELLK
jgi:hypothetical protein